MILVITLCVSSNAALLSVVSSEEMSESNTVALSFGKHLFGTAGSLFYAWIVCISCLGALNAIVFSAGRLTQAAGRRGYVPKLLERNAEPPLACLFANGREHRAPRLHSAAQNIPMNAMISNATIACVFVLTGTFRQLLTFKGVMEYTMYLITVFGLVRRNWHVGDQASLYAPVAFCALAALVVLRTALSHVLVMVCIVLFFGALLSIHRQLELRKDSPPQQ